MVSFLVFVFETRLPSAAQSGLEFAAALLFFENWIIGVLVYFLFSFSVS